jgi:hypothetical protein
LIELLGEQETFDPGALIFAAVREYAANHLNRTTWEKYQRGKPQGPEVAPIAG